MTRKKTQPTSDMLIQFAFESPSQKTDFKTYASANNKSMQELIEKALIKTYPTLFKK